MATSTGYQMLASFIVQERYEFYRQFQELACEDLFNRQSELVHLEQDVRRLLKQDQSSGSAKEEKMHGFDWKRLSASAQRRSKSNHWAKRLEIRDKIKEYYQSILLYRKVFSLPHPKE
ncbi:hypothetical protein DL95DRAFT_464208 [Leptodontidium sp. 2 PMI_412]|nr:hypothetical protein DL95DRAFT_464208 [Leptodontidium sp. 2 PMI_412]